MNHERLTTAQVIAAGILSTTPDDSGIPDDRERFDPETQGPDYRAGLTDAAGIIAALDAGKLVESANYYGIPSLWRTQEGTYRGVVMQYCRVTENEVFQSAEAAAEWFADMFWMTYG